MVSYGFTLDNNSFIFTRVNHSTLGISQYLILPSWYLLVSKTSALVPISKLACPLEALTYYRVCKCQCSNTNPNPTKSPSLSTSVAAWCRPDLDASHSSISSSHIPSYALLCVSVLPRHAAIPPTFQCLCMPHHRAMIMIPHKWASAVPPCTYLLGPVPPREPPHRHTNTHTISLCALSRSLPHLYDNVPYPMLDLFSVRDAH